MEHLYEDIKKVIQEELSIATQVDNLSDNLVVQIIEGVKSRKGENVEPGVLCTSFTINTELEDTKISVAVQYYNFQTKEAYEEYKKYYYCNGGDSASQRRLSFMWVYCYGISGGIKVNELRNVVHHEVEHIYQYIKGKETISKNLPLYNKAREYSNSVDEFERAIATIIYNHYDFEQDAMVNGLYGYLKTHQTYANAWDVVKESEAYRILTSIMESIEKLKDNSEYANDICLKKFNITLGQVISMGKYAMERLKVKIGKVLVKYRTTVLKENEGFFRLGYRNII